MDGPSKWAPIALGLVVILIILSIIYYYYYVRVDSKCLKEYVKYQMPGADDATIDLVVKWEINNVTRSDRDGKCKTGYHALSQPDGVSCTLCEIDNIGKAPVDVQNKIQEWSKTPEGAKFIKSQLDKGESRPPSMS